MTQFRIAAAKKITPEAVAQKVGDAGIVASLFVAPLWFGGRHDLGYLLYAVAVAVAAIGVFSHAALIGSTPRVSRVALVLLSAAMGLLALQSTPLPREWIDRISPQTLSLLPLWTGGECSLGSWRTLSITPVETREGLALLTCHALLLVAVATRLRAVDDVRRLLGWIGVAGVAMAAVALAQHAAPNGRLLWLYPHPHREMGDAVQGVFTNPNHFAQLMALALGPLCLMLVAATQAERRRNSPVNQSVLVVGMLSLVVVAGLAAQSRGGGVALAAAAVAALLVSWRCGAVSRARSFAMVFTALAVFAGVAVFGYDKVAGELDDLASGDVDTLDAGGARRAIWAANVEALRASPLVGFGAGAHRDFYPLFLEEAYDDEFTHAESGYLQVASETGIAGLLLLASGLGLFAWWAVAGLLRDRDAGRRLLWIGVAPGLVATVAHSAVDFVWFTPGLTAIVAALAACAMRLRFLASTEAETRSGVAGRADETGAASLTRVAIATALSALAIATLVPPARGALDWDRYLRVSRGLDGIVQQLSRDPSKADSSLAETMVSNTAYTTELLRRVVASDPGNARAHLRLAGRLLQRFELESARGENGMSVDLIRGAATGGGFATHGAMLAWLDRAFGERAALLRLAHAHARRAVELAPLQGEGYLYLAGLSFLDPGGPQPNELIPQALAVRPHDGEVLFEAGRQRHLTGDAEAAIELWRGCACRPGSHQHKLVVLLAGGVSAGDFVETLQPNHAVLLHALNRYREVGAEEDLAALADHARELALAAEREGEVSPTRLASRWALVSRTLRSVEDHEGAVEAAERAAVLAPHALYARLELASALRGVERYDEADPHIRWCLARRPDIRYLHTWLAEAAKRRTLVDRNRRSRQRLYEQLAAQPKETVAAEEASGPTDPTPSRR